LDLGFRGRLCLTGQDRVRFLHGQVTNDIKSLASWTGCYSALTTAKGKMQADLNIYRIEEELLLDFEPGLTKRVSERLEKYIVADDVQVVDVSSLYGLLSVQGPQAEDVIVSLQLFECLPEKPRRIAKIARHEFGEVYLVNQPRLGTCGFDLFVPAVGLVDLLEKLTAPGLKNDRRLCGWKALELARIEAGIPRYGIDMDETNFPQECGIEEQAVSYSKGCYIGQEVLNRIHTMGHVNQRLTGLLLANEIEHLPTKGDKLFDGAKETGYITSSIHSPISNRNIALGYVRKEANKVGGKLTLRMNGIETHAQIVPLPFKEST
jgi:folate-binding protein YgfZ